MGDVAVGFRKDSNMQRTILMRTLEHDQKMLQRRGLVLPPDVVFHVRSKN